MPTYVIGDVQGCHSELLKLLEKIDFNENLDRLWFVGDLVNRGPSSLQTLRFVKDLNDTCITVLGNHELHLLAIANGQEQYKHSSDTIDEILAANDREELLHWLRHLPLLHEDKELGYLMVHAGLAPSWNIKQARTYAGEVEDSLRSDDYREYFAHMYGNKPAQWSSELEGWDRLRTITNYFTRLRFCLADDTMDFAEKSTPGKQAPPFLPWFEISTRSSQDTRILFGHWAALRNYHVDYSRYQVYPLDTGCLWGGKLSAMRLEDEQWFSVDSEQANWQS